MCLVGFRLVSNFSVETDETRKGSRRRTWSWTPRYRSRCIYVSPFRTDDSRRSPVQASTSLDYETGTSKSRRLLVQERYNTHLLVPKGREVWRGPLYLESGIYHSHSKEKISTVGTVTFSDLTLRCPHKEWIIGLRTVSVAIRCLGILTSYPDVQTPFRHTETTGQGWRSPALMWNPVLMECLTSDLNTGKRTKKLIFVRREKG